MKKQLQIAGTERQTNVELNAAAEAYVEKRDARMALTKTEKEAHDALLAAMVKHKVTVYRNDEVVPPLVATVVEGRAKVKVSAVGEDGADEELN